MHSHMTLDPLHATAPPHEREARYVELRERIDLLLDDEDDWIAGMATVACELHHGFSFFHWTGFYRVVADDQLVIGPYQGTHGCVRIPYSRGVCGAAARTRRTQRLDDVASYPDHIACSQLTRSEIVVPVIGAGGALLAVLDVDSNDRCAFGDIDQAQLEAVCAELGARFG